MKCLLASVVMLAVTGCAGQSSQQSRRLAELVDKVTQLEGERDRHAARLALLEERQRATQQQAAVETARAEPPAGDRPLLRVIHLEPPAALAAPNETASLGAGESETSSERVLLSGSGSEFRVETVAEPSASGGGAKAP